MAFCYAVHLSTQTSNPSTTNSAELSSAEQSSSFDANSSSDRQEVPRILRNPNSIIVFTTAHHLFLPWARQIHYTPSYPISLRHLNIILPSTPRSSTPHLSFKCLNTLKASLFSSMRATFPAHLILHLIILITYGGEWNHEVTSTPFSPASSYFLPLWHKYLSQHPVLVHPQRTFVPQYERLLYIHILQLFGVLSSAI